MAADAMSGLGARLASEVIGKAFVDAGAQVAVVTLAEGGQDFADALGDVDPQGELVHPATLAELLDIVDGGTSTLWIDLTGLSRFSWDDLAAVTTSHIALLSERLSGCRVVAIVAPGGPSATLTGLSGRVAERGREIGADLADTLAANDAVSRWSDTLGVDGTSPGSGAADGVGAIILALGGCVLSGIEALAEGFALDATVTKADLVVTGAATLDFHAVGGDVVKEMARRGTVALRPVIAIVGRNFVSSRELRLAGLESAHPILEGAGEDASTPEQLAEVAGKVAQSWSW